MKVNGNYEKYEERFNKSNEEQLHIMEEPQVVLSKNNCQISNLSSKTNFVCQFSFELNFCKIY